LKNNHGFTLIEVMLSLILITIIASSFFALIGTVFKANHTIYYKDLAINWAQTVMEYFYRKNYILSSACYSYQDFEELNNVLDNKLSQVLQDTIITINKYNDIDGLFELNITVEWLDGLDIKEYKLSSFKYNK